MKTLIVILTCILTGISCQNKPHYTINGNISGNAEGMKVFLNRLDYPLNDPEEFKGLAARVYNVFGIPTCILLDKEGHIFKTDMRGAHLDAALQEIYD